jgi:hypothetical protein
VIKKTGHPSFIPEEKLDVIQRLMKLPKKNTENACVGIRYVLFKDTEGFVEAKYESVLYSYNVRIKRT